jgi:ribonuclease III
MTRDFKRLFAAIGYDFKNEDLLAHALCHRSAGDVNNERLEFLGDAILSAIIAEALYRQHPHADEGQLSRMRAILVSSDSLLPLAKYMDLGSYIHLGQGEIKSGGRERESILTDALEALLGAMYLDSDIETCRRCVLAWFESRLESLSEVQVKDPKSLLQEWAQAHKFPLPTYAATMSGKAHELIFSVTCAVAGLPHHTTSVSNSRKKAEQLAARLYLDLLNE